MRPGRLAVGIVLLAAAAALVVVALTVPFPYGSDTVNAGTGWNISTSSDKAEPVTIEWTGGTTTTVAYLATHTPNCSNATGVVANGTGASGSFTATLRPSTGYVLYACNGANWRVVTFTLLAVGSPAYTTPLEVTSALLVIVGTIVVVLGLRAAPARSGESYSGRRYYSRHR